MLSFTSMLSIYCCYTAHYIYAHAIVVFGPFFWGDAMQDLSLLHIISVLWGHIQLPIWPFHIRYSFRLVIHCFRPINYYCIGICIMHGLVRDELQTYIEPIWVLMRLFQPYVPSHDFYQCQISCIDFSSHIFYYGDLCTGHILRSIPHIVYPIFVSNLAFDFAPISTFRFWISRLSSGTVYYRCTSALSKLLLLDMASFTTDIMMVSHGYVII